MPNNDAESLNKQLGAEFSMKNEAIESTYKKSFNAVLKNVKSSSLLNGLGFDEKNIKEAAKKKNKKKKEKSKIDKLNKDVEKIYSSSKNKNVFKFVNSLDKAFNSFFKKEEKLINDKSNDKETKTKIEELKDIKKVISKAVLNPSPNTIINLLNKLKENREKVNQQTDKDLKLDLETEYDEEANLGKITKPIFEKNKQQLNKKLKAKEKTAKTVNKLEYNKKTEQEAYKEKKKEKIITDVVGGLLAEKAVDLLNNPSDFKNITSGSGDLKSFAKKMAKKKAESILNDIQKKEIDNKEVVDNLNESDSDLTPSEQIAIEIRESVEKKLVKMVEKQSTKYTQAKKFLSTLQEIAGKKKATPQEKKKEDEIIDKQIQEQKSELDTWLENK